MASSTASAATTPSLKEMGNGVSRPTGRPERSLVAASRSPRAGLALRETTGRDHQRSHGAVTASLIASNQDSPISPRIAPT
jgi:hypothetical protein